MDIRSFLAFELPPDVKEIISRVSRDLERYTRDVKRVEVKNIHLTLVFLGNVKAEDIGPLGDAVQEVCLGYGPFDVSLKGVGLFPERGNPRVIWLGLHGDIERMSLFKRALEKRLTPFGIKEEGRRYTPHLTLGRFRKSPKRDRSLEEFLLKHQDLTGPLCALDELILFKSDLRPGGPEYTRLGAWPLSFSRT